MEQQFESFDEVHGAEVIESGLGHGLIHERVGSEFDHVGEGRGAVEDGLRLG